MARSIGSLELELSQSLDIKNNRLYWCGYFRNSFTVDDFTLTAAGTDFNTFVMELDTNAIVKEIYPVTSEEAVLLTELTALSSGEVLVGGSLNGMADFDGVSIMAGSGYDSFVAKLNTILTSIKTPVFEDIKLYPNPAQDWVSIETQEVISTRVYSATGILMMKTVDRQLDCSRWEAGVYYLLITLSNGEENVLKMVKSN